jgi:hypothetical protein
MLEIKSLACTMRRAHAANRKPETRTAVQWGPARFPLRHGCLQGNAKDSQETTSQNRCAVLGEVGSSTLARSGGAGCAGT